PQSSKHSNRCTRHRRVHHYQLEWLLHNLPNIQTDALGIEGSTTPNGIAPPQSSKHSNRCTSHRRVHHSQLEWLLHNLLNIQTDALGIEGSTTLYSNGSSTIYYTINRIQTQCSFENRASEIPPSCKWLPHDQS